MKIITNTYLVLPTKEEEPFAGQDLVAWILSKSIETMSSTKPMVTYRLVNLSSESRDQVIGGCGKECKAVCLAPTFWAGSFVLSLIPTRERFKWIWILAPSLAFGSHNLLCCLRGRHSRIAARHRSNRIKIPKPTLKHLVCRRCRCGGESLLDDDSTPNTPDTCLAFIYIYILVSRLRGHDALKLLDSKYTLLEISVAS